MIAAFAFSLLCHHFRPSHTFLWLFAKDQASRPIPGNVGRGDTRRLSTQTPLPRPCANPVVRGMPTLRSRRAGHRRSRSSANVFIPRRAGTATSSASRCGIEPIARSVGSGSSENSPRPSRAMRAKPAGVETATSTSPRATANRLSAIPRPVRIVELVPRPGPAVYLAGDPAADAREVRAAPVSLKAKL